MNIFKVPSHAEESLRHNIASLLTGQVESLGLDHAYERVMHAINLALKENSSAHIFVAEQGERIVGAAFFNISISMLKGGYYIWLNDIYVHNDFRNQGIAKKILLKMIYWAESNDIKGIELETGINNDATKALYNSLGFYDVVSKRYQFRF